MRTSHWIQKRETLGISLIANAMWTELVVVIHFRKDEVLIKINRDNQLRPPVHRETNYHRLSNCKNLNRIGVDRSATLISWIVTTRLSTSKMISIRQRTLMSRWRMWMAMLPTLKKVTQFIWLMAWWCEWSKSRARSNSTLWTQMAVFLICKLTLLELRTLKAWRSWNKCNRTTMANNETLNLSSAAATNLLLQFDLV